MKPYALKNFSERYIKDKNINDVLEMTVEEGLEFFENIPVHFHK